MPRAVKQRKIGSDQRPVRRVRLRPPAPSPDLIIRDWLEYLACPRALGVWMLYRSGEHRQLVELSIDPADYLTADAFKRAFAATKFLSKCVGLRTGIDLEKAAVESAEEAELMCQKTNQRLRALRSGSVSDSGGEGSLFWTAADKIRKVLGVCPQLFGEGVPFVAEGPHSVLPFFRDGGWSKGRTTARWGDELTSTHKYAGRPDVSVGARKYASQLLRDSPLWGAAALNADGPCSTLTKGLAQKDENVMLTVPKSAKTDRVICYEPHLNIRLQLMVGDYIRRRLLRVGVDLNDQSVNQVRALRASARGDLATIDLKSASDTLALELVWELLPWDWACLLDNLRSKKTTWPGGQVRANEKFSSMGNGYTFELESLIFWALCSAVSDDVTVFGDDLILPAPNFDKAVKALSMAGFAVNPAKSFSTGPFRESCGTNGFGGFSVTPVYLRSLPKGLEDVVKLHNRIREWALQDPSLRGDPKVRSLLAKWRNIHPHLLGPSGYGDGHYHVEFQDVCPQRAGFWLEGWWVNTTVQFYRNRVWDDDGEGGSIPPEFGFAAFCAAAGPKRPRSLWDTGVSRRRVSYRRTRILVPVWPVEWWD